MMPSSQWFVDRTLDAVRMLRTGQPGAAEDATRTALERNEAEGGATPESVRDLTLYYWMAVARRGRRFEALDGLERFGEVLDQQFEKADRFSAPAIVRFKARVFVEAAVICQEVGLNEPSIGFLRRAQQIYEILNESESPEYVNLLAFLGRAQAILEEQLSAQFTLERARELASSLRDDEQRYRIAMIQVQHNMPSIAPFAIESTVKQAVSYAIAKRDYSTAHQRLGIGAQALIRAGKYGQAGALLATAKRLGRKHRKLVLDQDIVAIRYAEALNCFERKSGQARGIRSLLEAVPAWLEASTALSVKDLEDLGRRFHDPFRLLARLLLDDGRPDEALLAFELGRATAYTSTADPGFWDRLRGVPLVDGTRGLSLDVLKSIQQGMNPGRVVISLAIMPPGLVAFVIDRDQVLVVEQLIGPRTERWPEIAKKLRRAVERMELGYGKAALPIEIHAFVEKAIAVVTERVVEAVIPHGILHAVPWRLLFVDAGAPWSSVPAVVDFGLLRRSARLQSSRGEGVARGAFALGHGIAKNRLGDTVDLNQEAREFAEKFGESGIVKARATGLDVLQALARECPVLLSCHGEALGDGRNRQLGVALSDRFHAFDDLVPAAVRAPVVILSSCWSGAFEVGAGDLPVGAVPLLISRGAQHCIAARRAVDARMTADFFGRFGAELASGIGTAESFLIAIESLAKGTWDVWRQLAVLEIYGGP